MATRVPDRLGLYDMLGNVNEWVLTSEQLATESGMLTAEELSEWGTRGFDAVAVGGAFSDDLENCTCETVLQRDKDGRAAVDIWTLWFWHHENHDVGFRIVIPVDQLSDEEKRLYWGDVVIDHLNENELYLLAP